MNRTVTVSIVAAVVAVLGIGIYWASRPDVPDFSEFPAGAERKKVFFSYFLPIVQQRNAEILDTREQLKQWHKNRDQADTGDLSDIADQYGMDDFDVQNSANWSTLLRRVDVIPPSLALAQAANESAWGTSRFALEGYNYFGQWCFTSGCGMVPRKRDAGKDHEVAEFGSPTESVHAYMANLNRNSAYKGLRDVRSNLRQAGKPITGNALAAGLGRYSERGPEYVKELRSMMAYNKLGQYSITASESRAADG